MPRRRRKHRRPIEQEKPAGPFFAKARKEGPVTGLLASREEHSLDTKKHSIEQVRGQALEVLKAVECAIGDSQLDQALVNQSRALELANKMLAADIWDIALLQKAVKKIEQTIGEGQYFCGDRISHHYGKKGKIINLGHEFKQQGAMEQVYAMLKISVRHSGMPELYGMPAGGYEHTDPACAWTEYLCLLLNLLPDRPLLITGTVQDWLPSQPEEVQEMGGGVIGMGLKSLRAFFLGKAGRDTDTGELLPREEWETGDIRAPEEPPDLPKSSDRETGLRHLVRRWFGRKK